MPSIKQRVQHMIRALRLGWEMRAYPPHWLARLFGEGSSNAAGINVTQEKALTCAAFYAAVSLVSSSIAQLPLHLYVIGPHGAKEPATGNQLYRVLHRRPNPEQTAYVWRETMQSWALRWGNAYAEIVRNGQGRPVQLWPLPSDTMRVKRIEGTLIYIQNENTAHERAFLPHEILHIRTMGDGYVGRSPVALFKEAIGTSLAGENMAASFFGNGMRPGGVLEHPNRLSEKALEHLKSQLAAEHGGSPNAGKTLVLEEGMTWKQLSIPPDDAQFLESRVFQLREIARVFHIPPHKIGDLERATFSNIEEQNIEYVIDCLQPWLVNWEQEIEEKLLLPSEQDKFVVKFNVNGLLRGNAAARAAFYREMFSVAGLSPNEILGLEDMNPVPNGNLRFVPVNYQPLEVAARQALDPVPEAPEVTPEPPAEPTPEPDRVRAAVHAVLAEAVQRVVRAAEKKARRGHDVLDGDFGPWSHAVLRAATGAWFALLGQPADIDQIVTGAIAAVFSKAATPREHAERLLNCLGAQEQADAHSQAE